jgi:predicted DNA-binding protein (UPF0251 family)
MPRPRKCRRVGQHPLQTFYKPQGVPMRDLTGLNLPVEGLEALRLADAEEMEHAAAAEKMNVSRPTFSRILTDARRTVARALCNGWAIHISGGDYRIAHQVRDPLKAKSAETAEPGADHASGLLSGGSDA